MEFARPAWQSDSTTVCSHCEIPFSALKRKHHCRQCGHVFCNNCSRSAAVIPHLGYNNEAVRLCFPCATFNSSTGLLVGKMKPKLAGADPWSFLGVSQVNLEVVKSWVDILSATKASLEYRLLASLILLALSSRVTEMSFGVAQEPDCYNDIPLDVNMDAETCHTCIRLACLRFIRNISNYDVAKVPLSLAHTRIQMQHLASTNEALISTEAAAILPLLAIDTMTTIKSTGQPVQHEQTSHSLTAKASKQSRMRGYLIRQIERLKRDEGMCEADSLIAQLRAQVTDIDRVLLMPSNDKTRTVDNHDGDKPGINSDDIADLRSRFVFPAIMSELKMQSLSYTKYPYIHLLPDYDISTTLGSAVSDHLEMFNNFLEDNANHVAGLFNIDDEPVSPVTSSETRRPASELIKLPKWTASAEPGARSHHDVSKWIGWALLRRRYLRLLSKQMKVTDGSVSRAFDVDIDRLYDDHDLDGYQLVQQLLVECENDFQTLKMEYEAVHLNATLISNKDAKVPWAGMQRCSMQLRQWIGAERSGRLGVLLTYDNDAVTLAIDPSIPIDDMNYG